MNPFIESLKQVIYLTENGHMTDAFHELFQASRKGYTYDKEHAFMVIFKGDGKPVGQCSVTVRFTNDETDKVHGGCFGLPNYCAQYILDCINGDKAAQFTLNATW